MSPLYVSKTNSGLALLLAVTVLLVYTNRLSPEAVDVLKWLGTSFFLVRTGANVAENIGGKRADK